MLSFNNYHKPESIDEAYDILNKNKRSQVVGGGAFLRMGNRRLTDLIDISDLGLDQIIHQEDNIEIGGMTVFHKLETCPELPSLYRQYFKDALGQIVGVQLRNMVTVGEQSSAVMAFLTSIRLCLPQVVPFACIREASRTLKAFLRGLCPTATY